MNKQYLSRLDQKSSQLLMDIGTLADSLDYKAYLVGGPVRDLILGQDNIDLDITVEGNGIRLAESLAKLRHIKQIVRYQAFKTATVTVSKNLVIDFATTRKETYSRGGAFPKVESSNIKDDLFRRDFTINALALSINHKTWGKVIDPFKGMADLKAKKIKILHDKSFIDDPTRILRAARFMQRLGFGIDTKTLAILKSSVAQGALQTIKPQRYQKEFDKILKEPKVKDMIQCLKTWDAYREKK